MPKFWRWLKRTALEPACTKPQQVFTSWHVSISENDSDSTTLTPCAHAYTAVRKDGVPPVLLPEEEKIIVEEMKSNGQTITEEKYVKLENKLHWNSLCIFIVSHLVYYNLKDRNKVVYLFDRKMYNNNIIRWWGSPAFIFYFFYSTTLINELISNGWVTNDVIQKNDGYFNCNSFP